MKFYGISLDQFEFVGKAEQEYWVNYDYRNLLKVCGQLVGLVGWKMKGGFDND